MTEKRPSGDEIKGLLLEGNFAQKTPVEKVDPALMTEMTVTLDQLKLYDKNPRKKRNPNYSNIKSSIRALKGLTHPFVITRRPDDDKYIIESGGNTRLNILRELYEETKDTAFFNIQCFFRPYESEEKILIQHMIENVLRGEMVFIDRAYGLLMIKGELEEKIGSKISQKAFVEALQGIGYPISRRQMARYEYILELDHVIPDALRVLDIGPDVIDDVVKIEKIYFAYCPDHVDAFKAIWVNCMSEHDSEDWDMKHVMSHINFHLSKLLHCDPALIDMEINARINGIVPTEEVTEGNDDTKIPVVDEMIASGRAQSAVVNPSEQLPTGDPLMTPLIEANDDSNTQEDGVSVDASLNPIIQTVQTATDIETKRVVAANTLTLVEFREACTIQASKLAEAVGLASAIVPSEGGYGFIVDAPGSPMEEGSQTHITWWFLYHASGQAGKTRTNFWRNTRLFELIEAEQHQCIIGNSPENPTFIRWLYVKLDPNLFPYVLALLNALHQLLTHHNEEALWH